ncbi:MAG: snare associated golgi protein [Haloplasmataceae bacterium]|nr:snare associated golgi protein [Haloplasmataceae bacterium]
MKKYFDKKNSIKLPIFLVYIIIIIVLYLKGVIKADLGMIKEQLLSFDHLMFWYFLMSIFRILIFIPSTVFIIVGGLLFDPWIAFSLSMIAHAISQSIIYFFTKKFFDVDKIQKFILNNEKIVKLLKKYQLKLLAIGITCPVAPSDLLASASAIVGIKYIPYVMTVILAGAPLTFIYAFIGEQVNGNSIFNLILIIIFIFIFTIVSYRMYQSIIRDK